jgi:photosystem II stability/assembly factor-like uncharacterized protein
MADQELLYSRLGALWVQADGPNTQPVYVGCVDADALSEPGGGIAELIRCFRVDGTGWDTIGSTLTPPDPVTTTITALVSKTQHVMEQIKGCPATLFFLQRETGRADNFTNYVRQSILGRAYVSERSMEGIVMRDEDTPSTMAFGITAEPPAYRIFRKVTSRQSVGLANAANAIAYLDDVRCASGSGPARKACKIGFIAGDTPTGSPSGTSDVYYTTDYGLTWTATSTDPFASAEIIAALAVFAIGANTYRVIAARGTTDAGNPMEVAYSDDNGATWTSANLGSTNALFAQAPGSLFALDQYNIWQVTDGGYVFVSNDGGASWTAQEEGTATSEDLHAVHFANDKVGYAVGANDVVIRTVDGGFSWATTDADPGASSTNRTVFTLDAQRAWVGTLNGRLYYTEDAGATWTQRRFSGDNAGQVRDIRFVNELIGFMIHDTAAPVGRVFTTVDGGYTWELVTTTTNAGLNQLAICDENNAYAAGEVVSGTAALVKVQPAA